MERFFTLLLVAFSMVSVSANAQTCNPQFTTNISGNAVLFIPSPQTGDTLGSTTWIFGDGSVTTFPSSISGPTHYYDYCGTYTVKRRMQRKTANGTVICTDSATKIISIVCGGASSANFYWNTSVYTVHFYPYSQDTSVQHQWDFGDGANSTNKDPLHTYANCGNYIVKHITKKTSSNGTCADTIFKQLNITCPGAGICNAQFTNTLLGGATYRFKSVLGIDTGQVAYHRWYFGDGTYDYGDSATHTYNSCGTFTVSHSVYKYPLPGGAPCYDSTSSTVTVACPPNCNVHASYSYVRDTAVTNKVYFTNLSTPANDIHYYYWNFGDGTSSNQQNPVHTFPNSGLYHVCLTVRTDSASLCMDDTCMNIQIQLPPVVCNLQANFTWNADSVQINKIRFQNTTVNFLPTDSIRWNFGDGTGFVYSVNPDHVYATPGTYNVCIRVKRNTPAGTPACVSEICKTVMVQGPPANCNIVAGFSSMTDLSYPDKIHFINTSLNISASDSSFWNFGDGTTATTTSFNGPDHVYASAGNYNVCLKVKKYVAGNPYPCVSEYCKIVPVLQSTPNCNLNPVFSTHPLTPSQLNNIAFSNDSGNQQASDSITWSFGDGTFLSNTNAVVRNVNHLYANPGIYTTCMKVKRTLASGSMACIAETCKVVLVEAANCNLQANFNWHADSVQVNKIYFQNTTNNFLPTDSIRWNFGDGSPVSYDVNPTHVYTSAGVYNVCIRVKRTTSNGTPCVSEICKTVVVQVLCNIQANFTWQADSSQLNKIHFQNTTVNFQPTDSIRWVFGDGTVSYSVNPDHIYTNPGTYTVCIRVKRNNPSGTSPCVSEICKTVVVASTPAGCNLQANFTWNADSVNINKIYFHNTTVNFLPTDSIRWNFGDGTALSYNVNPDHIYASLGTYNVCIRVKRNMPSGTAACVSEICKTVVVQAPCTLQASFTSVQLTTQSMQIDFVNTTIGILSTDSVKWTFGDGTSGTGFLGTTHLYANPGTYTACLWVKRNGAAGTNPCISQICKVVIVAPVSCNLQANFAWQPDSLQTNKIHFQNTSTNFQPTDSIRWIFGDGAVSYSVNPDHVYANSGTYMVCLRVKRNTISGTTACVSEICKTVTVIAPGCNFQPAFTYRLDSVNFRKTYFTNTTVVASNATATWTFGDGASATSWNPIHEYAQAGRYYVCLKIKLNDSCFKTKCDSITVTAPTVNACNNVTLSYQAVRDIYQLNKYHFFAISNTALVQQRWTFTRVSPTPAPAPVVITQNNPEYVFQDTGLYRVCLNALTVGGCLKEYCRYIGISQLGTNTQCLLQAYPNPASNLVNIVVPLTAPEMIHAYVYNSINVLVKEKHQQGFVGNNTVAINIETLPAGWYTVKVIYGTNVCFAKFQKL